MKQIYVLCDYCLKLAEFRISSKFIYGKNYGPVYFCPCKYAYVGVHKGTTRPLGRLADAKLRKIKIEAHTAFDPIWKNKEMKRKNAYAWLAEKLGIEAKACHMGIFDEQLCRRTIRACKQRRVNNESLNII